MIVFQKQPDGSWQRTGERLPEERHVQILVDAQKPSGPAYTFERALELVEGAIAKGQTAEHYRYELAGATTTAKARAERDKKAGPKKERKPKAAAKKPAKAVRKTDKKESGHARHLRLKKAGICTACGKRKAQSKPGGKARHTECRDCREYYSKWAKDRVKKGAK